MPFKIVQTVEKGKKYLSVVPHHWEVDQKLYWPTKERPNCSDDSENNKPNETFMVYQCTLKRTSIATFKEATEISDVMRLQYDTDEKSIDESATKKVSKRKGPVQKENLGNARLVKEH